MYLTYEEYQDMGGQLDEATFTDCSYDAESIIDWYTFGRLKRVTNLGPEVKRCMYQLIKMINLKADLVAQSSGGIAGSYRKEAGIVQQLNDGVSTTYNVLTTAELLGQFGKQELQDMITRYLSEVVDDLGRKVLYRGYYPGE